LPKIFSKPHAICDNNRDFEIVPSIHLHLYDATAVYNDNGTNKKGAETVYILLKPHKNKTEMDSLATDGKVQVLISDANTIIVLFTSN